MRIRFTIEDDVKISSETVEIDVGNVIDRPSNTAKLKPLCKAIATLRGHYRGAEISGIEVDDMRVRVKIETAYSVEKFAERLQDYARDCQALGYDGIGPTDIGEELKEYLNERAR